MKVLGGIDVIGGLILILDLGILFPQQLLIVFGIAFVAKSSLGFWQDAGSWIDVLAGVTFFIMVFRDIPWIILVVVGVLVGQKGLFSFIGN